MTANDQSDPFAPARAALAEGDLRGAVHKMRGVITGASVFPPLDVVISIADQADIPALGDSARAAVAAPDDVHALRNLGYQLTEVGLQDVAVPVLRRALDLAPGEVVVLRELVVALDDCGCHWQSVQLLRQHPDAVAGDFFCAYLLIFDLIMSGDLPGARQAMATLRQPANDVQERMRERVRAMLERAALVEPIDELDLRGWHFVITAGVLTARSPYGVDDGMNGRWAYVSDSYEYCHDGLRRLAAMLDVWGRRPARVLALPDRASQALGMAAATRLGATSATFEADAGPGLVVAYDMSSVDGATMGVLSDHRERQPLYAHATCWTTPPPVAPDVVTLLYQSLNPPWGERMRVPDLTAPPNDRHVERIPADETSGPEVLADRILDADPAIAHLADDLPAVLAFARTVAPLAAATADTGHRECFWEGSPVPSARFL